MEDIINKIDGQVQIIFEKGEGYQTYRDAIWMSETEYNETTSETIDAIKQQRYDNWIAIITALPTEEPAMAEEPAIVEDSTPPDESAPTEEPAPSDSGITTPTEPV